MKKTFVRSLLIAATFSLAACGSESAENLDAPSISAPRQNEAPAPDQEQPSPGTMSKSAAAAAATRMAIQSTEEAEEHSGNLQVAHEEGNVEVAQDEQEQSLSAIAESEEAYARAVVFLGEAAEGGECDCENAPALEAYAEEGDEAALAVIDGCSVHAEATSGDESVVADVQLEQSPFCDDMALSLGALADINRALEDALGSCQEAVDAALENEDLAYCDNPDELLGDVPAEVDLSSALEELDAACQEVQQLESACFDAIEEASTDIDDLVEESDPWFDEYGDEIEGLDDLEDFDDLEWEDVDDEAEDLDGEEDFGEEDTDEEDFDEEDFGEEDGEDSAGEDSAGDADEGNPGE